MLSRIKISAVAFVAMIVSAFSYVTHVVSAGRRRLAAGVLVASTAAFGAMVLSPLSAMATETETEKGVHEVATKVSEEGIEIILAVLTALVALIVAVIVIPKAIGFIKRFV
jgi:hypothetical protein